MSRSAVALVRLAAPSPVVTTDTQLLRTFVAGRSDDSFAELVRRHGPMVLAVCRRVLSDAHDAEDAFQAVFLVLARKANAVRGSNVAGWLYGVTVRTARGVRIMRDRRKKHLGSKSRVPEACTQAATDDALIVTEQAAIIDEELAKLSDHHREAIVLCELRGLSRKRAATELGIPEGTLSSRLVGAKRKLAERLSARGVTASVALVAALSPATVSAGLLHTTTAAVRGAAGSVANAAAAAVLKGMLFDQLRAVALTAVVLVTVVCGGLAMNGPPDAPTGAKALALAPRRVADDPAAPLVEQLGSEDFAERESAQSALRKLGSKAEPALKAGLKSEDPEVRTRAAALLTVVRKDALAALVKGFDPKADTEPEHPVWKRFKAVAENTPASRELFARIIKNADWLRRLDAAEVGPDAAAQQYREAILEVGRHFQGNMSVFFFIPVWPCDTAEQAAYLMLLGSYPGTERAKPKDAADARLFTQGEGRIHFARGLGLGLQGKEIVPGPQQRYDATAALLPGSDRVFGKLLAAWLGRRTDEPVLYCGFELAVTHRATEVLSVARTIAGAAERGAGARVAALSAVAQFGARADLSLFTPLFDDHTVFVLPPPPTGKSPGPRSRRPNINDRAIGLALLLCDQDPFEYGFAYTKGHFRRANGRPVIANYEAEEFGFSDDDARATAHTKAKAFFTKQKEEPKPEPAAAELVEQLGSEDFAQRESAQKQLKELGSKARAALEAGVKSENPEIAKRCRELLGHLDHAEFDARHWARFAKVIGDDKPSRALFERIRSLRRNVELLDAVAADPKSASKLYHDRWAALNKAARTELGIGQYRSTPAPLADIVGWMYLGTFPGTENPAHMFGSLDFLPGGKQAADTFTPALKDETVAPAVRRLVGAWTAARADFSGRDYGLGLARWYDIKEVLPAARTTLNAKVKDDPYPVNTTQSVALALIVVGKLGTKDDLPLLEKYATSEGPCGMVLNDPPPKPGEPVFHLIRMPIEGRDATTQLRDLSAAMRLHLLGQDPDDFGFFWRRLNGPDAGKRANPDDRFDRYSIGFLRDTDRTAAHKKAKEWFDKQKK